MARVLIVDDEESIRVTLRAIVEKCGHRASIAEDASGAVELLEQEQFDVVVSDIVLPRKSGVALLAEIHERQPDVQVIMITGEPEVATAAESLRQGAFDYLAKPVSKDDLAKVLASAAARKQLLDRNRELEEENRRYLEDLEKRVESRTRELRLVNETARTLALATSIEQVLEIAHRSIRSHMDAESFIVSRFEPDSQLLTAQYACFEGESLDVTKLPPIPLEPPGNGTQSEVIHTGKPLYLPNYEQARASVRREYNIDNEGAVREGPPPPGEADVTRSAIYVPILIRGEVRGVMQAQSFRLEAYSEADISLLQGIASVVSVAIENARLLEGVREALHGTVGVLAQTTELRDPYTAGHQRRVASLANAAGARMGLSAHELEGLHIAGLLHDIGKLSIPAEILSKPAALTELEFSLIRAHPKTAYDLLKEIQFPWPVADAVLQHHERLDGSGYPSGLSGDEIVVEARVLAVADVVEAMASHRPYRPALGLDAALDEIERGRGISYDPQAVDACLGLFREGAYSLPE